VFWKGGFFIKSLTLLIYRGFSQSIFDDLKNYSIIAPLKIFTTALV